MSLTILLRAVAFTVVTWFAVNLVFVLLAVATGSGVGGAELTLAGVIGLLGGFVSLWRDLRWHADTRTMVVVCAVVSVLVYLFVAEPVGDTNPATVALHVLIAAVVGGGLYLALHRTRGKNTDA